MGEAESALAAVIAQADSTAARAKREADIFI